MEDLIHFLRESNNIEDEWDDVSLQQSILAWDYVIGQEVLTPEVVCETHAILMKYQDTLEKEEKGVFRDGEVMIAGRLGRPSYLVPVLIEMWCAEVNSRIKNKEIFSTTEEMEKTVIEDHVEYEEIHPFFDGNGRTGRIFLNWQRMKLGLPILVIKEADKLEYYEIFQ